MSDAVKFLIVDDVPANLDALDALLRRDGLTIVRAASGPEALEQLLLHDFALALIDVHMPDMSGLELAELMRGTRRTRTVPIILLTASSGEGRPFKGYEAGAVDYLVKPIDPHMLLRKAEVFFELDRQRRALVDQRDALEISEQRFRRTLMLAPAPVVLFDAAGTIISVNAEWRRGTGLDEGAVATMAQWLHDSCPDDAAALLASLAELIAGTRERLRRECRLRRHDGARLVWELTAHGIGTGSDGRPLFVCVAHDITERAEAERLRQLLVGELNHRVRNTLALVTAIAQQTLRQEPDPASFCASFGGRIQAVANAHAQLSDEHWRHADLADLVARQRAIGPVAGARIAAAGPPAPLSPHVALQAALILHELMTNAIKHGALSVPEGRVALDWTIADDRVELRWQEQGGPPVTPPRRQGFGSTLIVQGTAAVGGSATSEFAAGGLCCTISLPMVAGPIDSRLPDADVPAPEPLPAAVPDPVPGLLHRRRVLVVEDEPLIALQLADYLMDAGAQVIGPAASTGEALELLAGESVDVALLDGNLQGVRSDAVADALHRRQVPFAFVSGYGRASLPRGHDDAPVLIKPFDMNRLLATVESLLAARAVAV